MWCLLNLKVRTRGATVPNVNCLQLPAVLHSRMGCTQAGLPQINTGRKSLGESCATKPFILREKTWTSKQCTSKELPWESVWRMVWHSLSPNVTPYTDHTGLCYEGQCWRMIKTFPNTRFLFTRCITSWANFKCANGRSRETRHFFLAYVREKLLGKYNFSMSAPHVDKRWWYVSEDL